MNKGKRKVAVLEDVAPVPEILQSQGKRLATFLSTHFCGTGKDMTLTAFVGLCQAGGFAVTLPTLMRWRKTFVTDPDCFDKEVSTGRPAALDPIEVALMVGFVLHCNATHKQLSFEGVRTFLRDQRGVTVTLNTVSSYCHANGLSKQIARLRSGAQAAINDQQLLTLALEFIDLLESTGFYKCQRSRLCNMDVTFTTRRNIVPKTIAAKGRYVYLVLFCAFRLCVSSVIFALVHLLQGHHACNRSKQERMDQCHRHQRLG